MNASDWIKYGNRIDAVRVYQGRMPNDFRDGHYGGCRLGPARSQAVVRAPEKLRRTDAAANKGAGTFKHPITSSNPEAQAYFNQGFQLMYAFDKEGAIRSFRKLGSAIRNVPSATGERHGRGALT